MTCYVPKDIFPEHPLSVHVEFHRSYVCFHIQYTDGLSPTNLGSEGKNTVARPVGTEMVTEYPPPVHIGQGGCIFHFQKYMTWRMVAPTLGRWLHSYSQECLQKNGCLEFQTIACVVLPPPLSGVPRLTCRCRSHPSPVRTHRS